MSSEAPDISTSPLEPLLEPDEKLIWSGAPSADRLLMKVDYFLVPIGAIVMIAGFAGFFVELLHVLDGDKSWFVLLLPVAAFWLGFHFVVGHFIRRRRLAQTTVYGITDTRAIRARLHQGRPVAVRSSAFADRPSVRVHPAYEGRATIAIGNVIFFNVPEAERVETLLRQRT